MNRKELNRKMERSEARERRRKRRKRIVMIEKMTVALLGVVLLVGGSLLVYNMLPDILVARQLKQADEFAKAASYEDAIASCEEALQIDSTSVRAYQAMAGVYLDQEDASSAEKILYQGWETTQDEDLLQYYCTVLLNEAVADINAQACTLKTLDYCVAVLEKDPDHADAFRLLKVCYERLFEGEPEQEGLLCNTKIDGVCGYEFYQEMMLRLLLTYETSPSGDLKEALDLLASPSEDTVWMDVAHLSAYEELLKRVNGTGETKEVSELLACVQEAREMQDFFGEAFAIFESGSFEPIKEFMNRETYLSLRDDFIAGRKEHWWGKTYIPVSRKKMKFIKEDGIWKFAFADYEECPDTAGIISIWGVKQEDAGVQRVCISYEPASESGAYYPHTTYEFIYLYSNVQIGNEYVPQMNYRFETRVATPEGTTTRLVGDWGGDHEWTTEF